jgi:hypothetical protein
MKRALLPIGLLLAAIAWPGASALAADAMVRGAPPPPPAIAMPLFPRSERADAVWASGACWSECGSYTTWALAVCLEHDAQGRCLKQADAADRACQRECRSRGGPYLPIDTLFPLGD